MKEEKIFRDISVRNLKLTEKRVKRWTEGGETIWKWYQMSSLCSYVDCIGTSNHANVAWFKATYDYKPLHTAHVYLIMQPNICS